MLSISQDIPFAAAEGDSSPTQHSSRTPARQLLYELLELALGRDPISGLSRLRRREGAPAAVAAGGVQRHTVLGFFDGGSASSLPDVCRVVTVVLPQSCPFWWASETRSANRSTKQPCACLPTQAKGQRVVSLF